MARYDRIAPLAPPERGEALPGWLALRDLERDERDAELGRRARLHFLAVQPLRRLLENGIDGVSADSLERQLEGVREELGQLPSRDAERGHLAHFLHRIRQRTPAALVEGALDMGATAEETGYRWAAEEFYRTAYELAEANGQRTGKGAALRRLGDLLRVSGQAEAARDCLSRAAALALELDDHIGWARAMVGLASLAASAGQIERARSTLGEVAERGGTWADARVAAAAAAALASLELAAGDADRAVEYGWAALQRSDDEETRARGLLTLGAALRRLRLFAAADHAYALAAAADPSPRTTWAARAEHALSAAEAGDRAGFESRGAAVEAELTPELAAPWARAFAHLRLGQAEALLGHTRPARAHLEQVRALARRRSFPELEAALEELLPAFAAAGDEGLVALPAPPPLSPSAATRRIAEQLQALDRVAAIVG